MRIEIRHRCDDFASYRAARVKSLFNCETGANFALDAELPIERDDWQLGVVVGPSGSGKSSIGAAIWGPEAVYRPTGWPDDAPIVDAIGAGGAFDDATRALSAVGLGSVPAWLRPYAVLSTGERFRADLARIVCDAPRRVVIDEFSSVVDRQVARIGAGAFARAWRRGDPGQAPDRGPGQAVLLTCHYDVLDWLEPDWVFDTATGALRAGRCLWRRPKIRLAIHETDSRHWPLFEPHHYLKPNRMIAAFYYVGVVEGGLVAHVAVTTRPGLREARGARLVVMPEWQGAGIGLRFLNAVCERWRRGRNPYGRPMPTLFNTSHPGLAAALRRHPDWCQVSCNLHGQNKAKSRSSIAQSVLQSGRKDNASAGYGGHFRAAQGFRYMGEAAP